MADSTDPFRQPGSPAYRSVFIDPASVAKACHENNRRYCELLGDHSQVPWKDAPEWLRESVIEGVRSALEFHREWGSWDLVSPALMHEKWRAHRLADGWTYGDVKDADAKTHPCLRPWDELPFEQRMKDVLFVATIFAVYHGATTVKPYSGELPLP